MNSKLTAISLALICSAISGCAQLKIHGSNLGCPGRYSDYCGGWSVTQSTVPASPIHLVKGNRFLIGGVGNTVYLFPRSDTIPALDLRTRWNSARAVQLTPIRSGKSLECLVGLVNIIGHTGSDPNWHEVTIRSEHITDPAADSRIGEETRLDICVVDSTAGATPTQCGNCDSGAGSHGGRAHAQD